MGPFGLIYLPPYSVLLHTRLPPLHRLRCSISSDSGDKVKTFHRRVLLLSVVIKQEGRDFALKSLNFLFSQLLKELSFHIVLCGCML